MVGTTVARAPASTAPARRRRWRTLWVVAPALFVVLLATSRIVYWRSSIAYHPLRLVGVAAPAAGQPASVKPVGDRLVSTARAGTDRVYEVPLQNDGIHPIDINHVTSSDDAVVGVQWAANHVQAGRRVPSPSHPLPVHVPAHSIVNLQLVVRQPACVKGTARYLSGTVTLHWHAMISPHATRIDLLAGHPTRLELCPGT